MLTLRVRRRPKREGGKPKAKGKPKVAQALKNYSHLTPASLFLSQLCGLLVFLLVENQKENAKPQK